MREEDGGIHHTEMAGIVERNIQELLARRRAEERRRSVQEKVADGITRFTGSMLFVYIHLALFGSWVVINLGWTPIPQFERKEKGEE